MCSNIQIHEYVYEQIQILIWIIRILVLGLICTANFYAKLKIGGLNIMSTGSSYLFMPSAIQEYTV